MRIGLVVAVFVHTFCWLGLPSAVAQPIGMHAVPIERRAPPPRIMISTPVETPVRIESVKVRTEVSGSIAQTEVEMLFRNPNARVLEGELQFPLLDGQSVSGFAMDVNGTLREAVPVEKARGQAIFEEIIRGQIDPGLLEGTQGNNFKLRVYPIPANGTKQVVVRYTESLAERNDRLVYRLPLEYATRLDHFLLDLRIGAAGSAPIIKSNALGGFDLVREGNFFTARVARSQFAGRGYLELEIPRRQQSQVYTQRIDHQTWFYAEVPVPVREASRKSPRILGIVWDSSGSAASRDPARELALLDAYLRRIGNAEVRLIRIRDAAEPAQSFRIANGDWRALRAALESTPYDGGTNLGAFIPERGIDEYLLFSDGLGNFGEQPFAQARVPLHAISSAARANPTWLRHIAERSGGRYIDLTAEDASAAAHKLATASTRIVDVSADGATHVVLSSPFPERGRIRIAGELHRPNAKLTLKLEEPGGRISSLPLNVDAREAGGQLAAQLWASLHVATLEAEHDLNRAEIRRLGRRFGLVTRETSLIVLDRIEDYARHEITPPPELLADYERARKTMTAQREADRSRHLAEIVRRFEEKLKWWDRDFPKDERVAVKAHSRDEISGAVGRDMRRSENERALREDRAKSVMADALQARPAAPAADAPARLRESRGRHAVEQAAATSQASVAIRLAPWQPNAPYMDRLRNAESSHVYRVYLDERRNHLASTAFFLDAADVLFAKGLPSLAVRVLSNLAEMDLENRHILRILGYRLLQAQQPKLAVAVFRKVLDLSPEEPQSYRDLGLALNADGQPQKAIDMLYEVVVRPWHNRFPEIELITLAELNAIVANAATALDTSRMHPKLLRNLPLDLRVVLTWDADNTDIDLWVTDPNGERAYYGNRLTYQGGRMSMDFTGGYGPEEFSLKRAKPGRYRIEAQYYGDRRQAITGPTTLQVKLATKFGLPDEQERLVTLRLSGRSEVVLVGEFEVAADTKD